MKTVFNQLPRDRGHRYDKLREIIATQICDFFQ